MSVEHRSRAVSISGNVLHGLKTTPDSESAVRCYTRSVMSVLRELADHGIHGRGSRLDRVETPGFPDAPHIWDEARYQLNLKRRVVPCGVDVVVMPEPDKTPPTGAFDVKLVGGPEDLRAVASSILTSRKGNWLREWPIPNPSRTRWDKVYEAAWESLNPMHRVTTDFERIPDPPYMSVLKLQQISETVSVPPHVVLTGDEARALQGVPPYGKQIRPMATMYITATRTGDELAFERRDRTSNLDGLTAPIEFRRGQLYMIVPPLPDVVDYSDKTMDFYRQQFMTGHQYAAIAALDSLLRTIRKLIGHRRSFSDRGMARAGELIKGAMPILLDTRVATVEQDKLATELMVARIIDKERTDRHIGHFGLQRIPFLFQRR